MSGLRRILLVRHAPVDGPSGIIHGPLAPADLADAELIAATCGALARSTRTPSLWCSPATRTRQTATALNLEPAIDARLSEQNFGSWTGRRHADLEVEYGAAYTSFWSAAAVNTPPGGESFAQQVARMEAFLSSLPPGDHILISHSGAIRAAIAIALRMDLEAALSLVVDPLSITRLEHMPGGWRVAYVNRVAIWR